MKNFIIASLLLFVAVPLFSQADRDYREQNRDTDQDGKVTATLKSSSRLFGEKHDLTAVIMIIPSGSVVEVLASDSSYYHIFYESNEGFIFRRQAEINREPEKRAAPGTSKPKPGTKEARPVQSQRISRFSYLEQKYGSNTAARLMEGKIWLGMSADMVKDSWGSPQKISRVISGNFIKEEWIYNNTWLYIENNTLLEWGPVKR